MAGILTKAIYTVRFWLKSDKNKTCYKKTMCDSVDMPQATRLNMYEESCPEQTLYRITNHISFCKPILRKANGFQKS